MEAINSYVNSLIENDSPEARMRAVHFRERLGRHKPLAGGYDHDRAVIEKLRQAIAEANSDADLKQIEETVARYPLPGYAIRGELEAANVSTLAIDKALS